MESGQPYSLWLEPVLRSDLPVVTHLGSKARSVCALDDLDGSIAFMEPSSLGMNLHPSGGRAN